MQGSLHRGLNRLRFGDHVCLSYDHPDEARAPLVPYFRDGLLRGERCVFVGTSNENDQLAQDLTGAGVDVRRAREQGRLLLQTPAEVYPQGAFKASDMLSMIDKLVEHAVASGFAGLRGAGEMVPTPPPNLWQELRDYEAHLNERCAALPFIGLCRYNHATCPPEILRDGLRTHPIALIRGQLCDNPFYETPAVAVRPEDNTARVAWMLRQLRWSQRTRQHMGNLTDSLAAETAQLASENQRRQRNEASLHKAIEMRDRFLAMLADALSTPMTPLLTQLQSLTRSLGGGRGPRSPRDGTVSPDLESLERVALQITQLSRTIDQARDILRLTNREMTTSPEEFDLTDMVRQVTLRRREQLADAGCTIALRTSGRIQGRWDRDRVERVVGNLLMNAMTRGRGKAIDLDLSSDEEIAALAVRDRGAAIMAADLATLFERLEGHLGDVRQDAAQGMWVTREIVSALGGEIGVANQPQGCVTFLVELPRSRAPRRWSADVGNHSRPPALGRSAGRASFGGKIEGWVPG